MKNNFKFLILLMILFVGCICVGSTFAVDASVSDVSDICGVDNTGSIELVADYSSQKDVEILTMASDISVNENLNINGSVDCSKESMGNDLYYKVSINDTSYTTGNVTFFIEGGEVANVTLTDSKCSFLVSCFKSWRL